MKKISYSTATGKTTFYKATTTFEYAGKSVPNWEEIDQIEFNKLFELGYSVSDGTTC